MAKPGEVLFNVDLNITTRTSLAFRLHRSATAAVRFEPTSFDMNRRLDEAFISFFLSFLQCFSFQNKLRAQGIVRTIALRGACYKCVRKAEFIVVLIIETDTAASTFYFYNDAVATNAESSSGHVLRLSHM